MGSIPTLLVAQSLDQFGGSKEQREGDGLRNYLGVTLKIKCKLQIIDIASGLVY